MIRPEKREKEAAMFPTGFFLLGLVLLALFVAKWNDGHLRH
jgi:hypothetical protein